MNEKFYYYESEMKKASKKAMHFADMAHEAIFKEPRDNAVITGFLNAAGTEIVVARSLYLNHHDELEHDDIDEFFYRFSVFVNEVLTNIAENHSHQWSDIEFNNLQEAYQNSVLSS